LLGEKTIESRDKALAIATAAQDRKGQNLTIIQVDGQSSYTDFLVIVTAYSERMTNAIADTVIDDLKKKGGQRPLSREGDGTWILVDYGDVVLHVFHEDARAYYDLDRLWADATRIPVPPPEQQVIEPPRLMSSP